MIEAPFGRICIVMMSAVGDAVHVLPVINAIKRRDPAARITWILQPGPATLVRGHRAVDEILLFERSKGWRAFGDMRRELAAREFDLVINLQVYFKAGIVTAFTRAPVKLGFDRARARDFNWLFTTDRIPSHRIQHVQDQYFEFLTSLGVAPEPVTWDLGPWPDERTAQSRFFESLDRPAASLVIGTSNPEKDWIPERWAQVCDALWEDFGLQAVLVGSRSAREVATEQAILRSAAHKPRSALASGLRNLVGILDGSAVVISPDTGPLHMSVALDRPVISLMGYQNPTRTGPYRRFHDLMVDAYSDPGEQVTPTMEHRSGRMGRIRVRDVLERVERWRARYASVVTGPKS